MLTAKGEQCRKGWTIVVTYESGVTRYLCATHSAKLQEQRNKHPELYEPATFRGALQSTPSEDARESDRR
jgi:hypothetical protein